MGWTDPQLMEHPGRQTDPTKATKQNTEDVLVALTVFDNIFDLAGINAGI